MQNSNIYLTFAVLSFFLFSCKSESKPNPVETSKTETIDEGNLVSLNQVSDTDIDNWNKSAISILEHRIKQDKNESWAAIEHGIWEYEAIFADGKMSQPNEVKGRWIDFLDDATYQYGEKAAIKGKGKYHYSPETGLLLMVDDNKAKKPIEYKAKIVGDIFVFTGSTVYKDNGTQGKLNKIMQRPS